jgi:hypothetical protein
MSTVYRPVIPPGLVAELRVLADAAERGLVDEIRLALSEHAARERVALERKRALTDADGGARLHALAQWCLMRAGEDPTEVAAERYMEALDEAVRLVLDEGAYAEALVEDARIRGDQR